ncbi:hypothetical protein [Bradyrhizobium sp. AUGA SZCCT0222]|uniref:hypothetical protein n=1 Tax=Bradyrhizobium sp. AUGA SZCCT0222 TaxID=2807668 RepID=UPI002012DAA2|nr:hypothetical protein [Bradyrhizobium sp. AUGA SZCCT0222]
MDIQRKARSTRVVDGASGQLEKRVTSGTDISARNAGTSFGVAARNVSRLVDNRGNFRLAVGGMEYLSFDFASQSLRSGLNCR